MGWNDKYYSKIVNGVKQKNGLKKYSSPTVSYLFCGLNHGFKYFDNWKNKRQEIEKLIIKYFFIWNNF